VFQQIAEPDLSARLASGSIEFSACGHTVSEIAAAQGFEASAPYHFRGDALVVAPRHQPQKRQVVGAEQDCRDLIHSHGDGQVRAGAGWEEGAEWWAELFRMPAGSTAPAFLLAAAATALAAFLLEDRRSPCPASRGRALDLLSAAPAPPGAPAGAARMLVTIQAALHVSLLAATVAAAAAAAAAGFRASRPRGAADLRGATVAVAAGGGGGGRAVRELLGGRPQEWEASEGGSAALKVLLAVERGEARAGLHDAWELEAALRSRTVGEDSGARALQLVGEMVTLRTPSPLRSRISARACTLLRVLTVQFRLEEA